jgi:hypothetical protein
MMISDRLHTYHKVVTRLVIRIAMELFVTEPVITIMFLKYCLCNYCLSPLILCSTSCLDLGLDLGGSRMTKEN